MPETAVWNEFIFISISCRENSSRKMFSPPENWNDQTIPLDVTHFYTSFVTTGPDK